MYSLTGLFLDGNGVVGFYTNFLIVTRVLKSFSHSTHLELLCMSGVLKAVEIQW